MSWQGWIFMILSWTVIIGLFGFCMTRTLRPDTNKKENEPEQQSES